VIYPWIQFLHVLGALGFAAAYAVEAAGLVGLRQSVVADEARTWFRTRRWGVRLGPASLLLVLGLPFGHGGHERSNTFFGGQQILRI
jgi:Zn-dependent protease